MMTMMISESELYTVFDLYIQHGKRFGFAVVNALPRSYAVVRDFGRFVGRGDEKRWLSFDPMQYTESEAHRRNLGYRVDRFEFETNYLISKDLFLIDGKDWSLHRP